MTAVMVENKVKGNRDNRRFNDQAKKQQGQQNRGNERRQQEDKRPNQAAPRIDFKARCGSIESRAKRRVRSFKRGTFRSRLRLPKPWLKLTNAKEPEEIFEEAAKLAEQAQQEVQAVVETAPVKKKLQWIHVVRSKPDQTKNVTITITKKMVLENNKRIK